LSAKFTTEKPIFEELSANVFPAREILIVTVVVFSVPIGKGTVNFFEHGFSIGITLLANLIQECLEKFLTSTNSISSYIPLYNCSCVK